MIILLTHRQNKNKKEEEEKQKMKSYRYLVFSRKKEMQNFLRFWAKANKYEYIVYK